MFDFGIFGLKWKSKSSIARGPSKLARRSRRAACCRGARPRRTQPKQELAVREIVVGSLSRPQFERLQHWSAGHHAQGPDQYWKYFSELHALHPQSLQARMRM
jgi:hypothetical protein